MEDMNLLGVEQHSSNPILHEKIWMLNKNDDDNYYYYYFNKKIIDLQSVILNTVSQYYH